jgi:hypothetical protein
MFPSRPDSAAWATQSKNFRFGFMPNRVFLTAGSALFSSKLSLSSSALLMSILPPPPTIDTPPALTMSAVEQETPASVRV